MTPFSLNNNRKSIQLPPQQGYGASGEIGKTLPMPPAQPDQNDPWAWNQWAQTQDPGMYGFDKRAVDITDLSRMKPGLEQSGKWNPDWDAALADPSYFSTLTGNEGSESATPSGSSIPQRQLDLSSLAGYTNGEARSSGNNRINNYFDAEGNALQGVGQVRQATGSFKSKDYKEMAVAAAAMMAGGYGAAALAGTAGAAGAVGGAAATGGASGTAGTLSASASGLSGGTGGLGIGFGGGGGVSGLTGGLGSIGTSSFTAGGLGGIGGLGYGAGASALTGLTGAEGVASAGIPYEITSADMGLPESFSGFENTGAQAMEGANVANTTATSTAPTGADPWGFGSKFNLAEAGGGNWYDSILSGLGNQAVKTGGNVLSAAILQRLAGKPPKAPDFAETANRQTEANAQAAQVSNQMNRVDTTTPYGSQTFNRTADPNAPGGFRYSQDIRLSPEQQALYAAETGNQIASQRIAGGLQQGVANSVGTPFSLAGAGTAGTVMGQDAFSGDREKVTRSLFDRLTRLRGPQMQRDVSGLDTQLRNQGLMPGTEAYDNGMRSLREAQAGEMSDQADRAILAGGQEQSRMQQDSRQNTGLNNQVRGQTIQEMLLQRQQPLAEYNSFRTGNTPTLPSFQPFGMSQTQAGNLSGAAQSQYNASADQYNARQGQIQSLLNLFGTLNKPGP